MTSGKKPWGGRFKEPTDTLVEAFTASLDFDKRLYRYDIEGSIAHAAMLARQGIIAEKEAVEIERGLRDILDDIENGNFTYSNDSEDIHMAIEKSLMERIGQTGGKLHTARSRNDQVSLDVRLFMRDHIEAAIRLVKDLKSALLELAKKEIDTILPGYTHLQKAQPVLLAHYLLAYWEMFDRDQGRLENCFQRTNVMPLGSAALAGTGIPIDRDYVAGMLNFPAITKNSMDAVSDRDFVAEYIFDAGLIMMHMSRFCEDLIIWSSEEVGFVEISDSFTTGSSIMPQKKNPDVAELIRGKTGRVYGNLMAILTLLKGLPMSYDRDLQEDKEPLFDTVDTVEGALCILSEMTKKLKFDKERMLAEAKRGFATATDVAEYLVMKKLPFREAHEIVGRIVAYCIEKGIGMQSLSLEDFRSFYEGFEEDVFGCLTVEHSVNARNIPGGTSRTMVLKRIAEIEN